MHLVRQTTHFSMILTFNGLSWSKFADKGQFWPIITSLEIVRFSTTSCFILGVDYVTAKFHASPMNLMESLVDFHKMYDQLLHINFIWTDIGMADILRPRCSHVPFQIFRLYSLWESVRKMNNHLLGPALSALTIDINTSACFGKY